MEGDGGGGGGGGEEEVEALGASFLPLVLRSDF